MNTLKFLEKSYTSNPYVKAFLDKVSESVQTQNSNLIVAIRDEATAVLNVFGGTVPTAAPAGNVTVAKTRKRKPAAAGDAATVVKMAPATSSEVTLTAPKKRGRPRKNVEAPVEGAPAPVKAKRAKKAFKVKETAGLPVISDDDDEGDPSEA